jgi:CHAD domain-containing protein
VCFAVRCDAPSPAEVSRVAREQIGLILFHLRRLDEEAVHEIRKATKRLRALVRLVRDELSERGYRRENRTFRDAARVLSGARDAAVLAHTLAQVSEHLAGEVRPRTLLRLRRAIEERRRRLAAEHPVGRPELQRRERIFERARTRVGRWPIRERGWATIEPGLARIYRKGRRCFELARSDPSDANLHEWRKRVKDLRYALELLEPLWPDVVHALAKEVDELAEALGADHDLALLRRLLEEEYEANDADGDRMLALLDVRRARLQSVAWALGPRVYAEKPGPFVRRLGGYWDACQRAAGALDAAAAG